MTFQYARRRKHLVCAYNPFALEYKLINGIYMADAHHVKTIEEYIAIMHPEKLKEFLEHHNPRSEQWDAQPLRNQLDYKLSWSETPSGLAFWMNMYNTLCIADNLPQLCRH